MSHLLSTVTKGDVMVLTYDKRVHPDNSGTILEGFSLAGEDGKSNRMRAGRVIA